MTSFLLLLGSTCITLEAPKVFISSRVLLGFTAEVSGFKREMEAEVQNESEMAGEGHGRESKFTTYVSTFPTFQPWLRLCNSVAKRNSI